MNLKSYLSVAIASIATLAGASAAQAASLQGRVGINPPSPTPGGESTGIVFTGTGTTDPSGIPLADLDFVPPDGGGVGPIVELNANPFRGENDFLPFVGQTGTIKDITVTELLGVGSGAITISEFINIPGAFSATLTDVEFPVYTFDGDGTTVSIGVEADFFNLSDGTGDKSNGVGTFSVDFAGLSIAETQALFDEPGETPEEFNPGTWSSNFEVSGVVPEASNLMGLIVIGLGGAAMLARKKK